MNLYDLCFSDAAGGDSQSRPDQANTLRRSTPSYHDPTFRALQNNPSGKDSPMKTVWSVDFPLPGRQLTGRHRLRKQLIGRSRVSQSGSEAMV